jgi:hypothetical protein
MKNNFGLLVAAAISLLIAGCGEEKSKNAVAEGDVASLLTADDAKQ